MKTIKEIAETMSRRFASSNDIPISDARLNVKEYEALKNFIDTVSEYMKCGSSDGKIDKRLPLREKIAAMLEVENK